MEVSVIIPAYNEESIIERTLKNLPNAQKIVVCNGCTDNTAKIAKKYAEVIETPKKGVSHARNLGVKLAKHDKLIFLDADIKVDEKTIPLILKTSSNIGTTKVKADSDRSIDKLMMFIKSQTHWMGFNTGLIYCTKEMFNKVNGFDTTKIIHEDGKFLRDCKKIGNFKVLDSYVYNNMRRFKKKGYLNIITYWIKETILPTKKYETIR
jgi:glycosyltransferase involved in cell wall biosynthesis